MATEQGRKNWRLRKELAAAKEVNSAEQPCVDAGYEWWQDEVEEFYSSIELEPERTLPLTAVFK